MNYSSYHTHTAFCDGNNSPQELVLEAIRLGCPEIGFSGHSYTFFDESYCMSKQGTQEYKECILCLRKKYAGKIKILLGIEQDYFSEEPTADYDYVIGSVHYVKKDEAYLPVDESRDSLMRVVKEYYGGDYYALAADYYETVAKLYEKTGCNIIGHFDLITKFNGDGSLFNVKDERYLSAVNDALDKLIKLPVCFEINYGAVAMGYKNEPYPQAEIIDRLEKEGSQLICTSDCHSKEFLLFGLENYIDKTFEQWYNKQNNF